jgi:hypothetical protein
MITGSCLCGGIRFEIESAVGPFEICHCNRCRKRSGAAALAMIRVLSSDFKLVSGRELIKNYDAPLLYRPPAYQSSFCAECGSPAPPADPEGESLEIPAGLLDTDPEIKPDKHIFVEFVPPWDRISDGLPRYDVPKLFLERHGVELPQDFQVRKHGDSEARGR